MSLKQGPGLTLNTVILDPTMRDLMNLVKKELSLSLNCHHVGTVQSFNATNMTVVATINYPKTFLQNVPNTKTYKPVQVNYPALIDCPIVCLGGGKTNMTFPIAKGDECLLLFNDRDIENWFSSGQPGPVATAGLHAFADAFALVGVKSVPNVLTAYDVVRALMTNGNVNLGINPSNNKVLISNTANGTLNTVLQNIVTQLKTLCTQCAAITVSGVTTGAGTSAIPVNAASITAVSTQLTTLATTLGSILE